MIGGESGGIHRVEARSAGKESRGRHPFSQFQERAVDPWAIGLYFALSLF